ncbi:hypothetical protein RBI14_20220 [Alcaligenaceae bacterium B3P038]|nr:hypothetical protein [Alcaligenaceae bacterium B3P038]
MSPVVNLPPRRLTISVREARLIVERILLTLDIGSGYAPAVRDVVLTSQALGRAGFVGLADTDRQTSLRVGAAHLAKVSVQRYATYMAVTAPQLHAWLVLPIWLDQIVAKVRQDGSCECRIAGVTEPAELFAIVPHAARYGIRAVFDLDEEGGRVYAEAASGAEATMSNPCLQRALREGFDVAEAQWWPLYEASKKALSPDSVTSRRHAGPTIVQDDGTVIGRPPADDDTDIALLRHPH